MGTGVISWIIGPQIIGFIFLLMGLIQTKYPPKKINNLYGYRTPASMKNQETWDAANRYSAGFAIKAGFFLLIAGLAIAVLLHVIPMPQKVRFVIFFLSIIGSAMGSAIAIMVSTEKHLGKIFDGEKE